MGGGADHGADRDLLGRDRELECLIDLVTRHDVRLVTITGMPGVGKTSLARAVLDAVGHGQLVPAATMTDVRLLEDAFVGSRRLSPDGASPDLGGSAPPGDGRRVVVLDDVDSIDGLAGAVTNLLSGPTSTVVLLTAIRPTHLPGEHLVRVDPLPLPSGDDGIDQPAIALFVERAT